MQNPFDPSVRELDMINLTLLVFLPTLFALVVLLIPSRWKELMRWIALIGMATTLTLSACRLVDYYFILDSRSDRETRSLYHPATTLESRSDQQLSDSAHELPKAFNSFDLLTRRVWVSRFDINYALGADGLSLLMVLLTCTVGLLALVASWKIELHLKGYLFLILLLQTGVIGSFLAIDLFLFFVFYELMLMPMFFLIGIWGGGRRKYAAVKFVIYTLCGSVGILAAIIALYSVDVKDFVDQGFVRGRIAQLRHDNPQLSEEAAFQKVEIHTLDPFTLIKVSRAVMLVLNDHEARLHSRTTPVDSGTKEQVKLFAVGVKREEAIARLKAQSICSKTFQYILFALLFIGFAVKVPLVPVHSWLPDAHVEAPTPISMILAGVLLKLGGYGLIRFAYPLAPWAAIELSWWVGLLGVISIIYGALVAMGQTDFKKLLAYSSISHMGYVVLGLAACGSSAIAWERGLNGAVYQMLAHGITATGLFFVVGVVYERAHHREVDRLGGLKEPMPLFSGLSAVLFFASLGLPGLCGFVGEFLVMTSVWSLSPVLSVLSIFATILTAGYLLWTWQRVFLGTNPATANFPEIYLHEVLVVLPLVLLSIVLGILPVLIFNWVEPSLQGWIDVLDIAR